MGFLRLVSHQVTRFLTLLTLSACWTSSPKVEITKPIPVVKQKKPLRHRPVGCQEAFERLYTITYEAADCIGSYSDDVDYWVCRFGESQLNWYMLNRQVANTLDACAPEVYQDR